MRSTEKLKYERALTRQVERLDRRLSRLEALSNRFSWIRLGIVLGGMGAAWAAFSTIGNLAGAVVMTVAVAGFVVSAVLHDRVEKSIRRHRIWRDVKARHVARMNLDWEHLPLPANGRPDPGHPFEPNLNLTGPRSILHLIDTTVSQEGSDLLRSWLLATEPDPAAISERQQLVRELKKRSIFRDRLTLQSTLVTGAAAGRWKGETLIRWLDHHTDDRRVRRLLLGLGGLAGVNVLLFVLWVAGPLPAWWLFPFTFYVWIYLLKGRAYSHLFDQVEHLMDALDPLRAVLLYLERYRFGPSPHLERFCEPFRRLEARPSRYLRSLTRLAMAASSQRSELVWLVLNAIVPWDLFFMYRLSRFKAALRGVLPEWLERWYELEVLSALATFADLNPDYTFPVIDEDAMAESRPIFEAHQIGHPLIPDEVKVCNDLTVSAPGEILIVTGSNMSGKSTFLRTLGVNLALAFAGGPVDAESLRTIPFRLFTCINVNDSVNDGISYFYAEVRRLKALLATLDETGRYPVFFLIDEIFRGTNNRERLIGSRSYVRALAQRCGAGVISTHDLELVRLADENPSIHNMHFREEVVDGRMHFEYRLRPGPSPTTNALKIMQIEGLPVDPA